MDQVTAVNSTPVAVSPAMAAMNAMLNDGSPVPPQQVQQQPDQTQPQPNGYGTPQQQPHYAPQQAQPPAAPQQYGEAAPAGDGQANNGQHLIPKARFDQVLGQSREAAAYARQMEAERNQLLGMVEAMRSMNQPQAQQQAAPPPPPRPDHITQPEQYESWLRNSIATEAQRVADERASRAEQAAAAAQRQAVQATWHNQQEMVAAKVGPQVFAEAVAAVKAVPGLSEQFSRQPNPYAAAVTWYQQQQVLRTVGTDVNAYKQNVLAEAMKNPNFVNQVAAQLRNGVQQPGAVPPPSLSALSRNSAVGGVPHATGAQAIEAMLAQRENAFRQPMART